MFFLVYMRAGPKHTGLHLGCLQHCVRRCTYYDVINFFVGSLSEKINYESIKMKQRPDNPVQQVRPAIPLRRPSSESVGWSGDLHGFAAVSKQQDEEIFRYQRGLRLLVTSGRRTRGCVPCRQHEPIVASFWNFQTGFGLKISMSVPGRQVKIKSFKELWGFLQARNSLLDSLKFFKILVKQFKLVLFAMSTSLHDCKARVTFVVESQRSLCLAHDTIT